MADFFFKAQKTRWDGLASDKFRFIHEDNVLKITHNFISTQIEHQQDAGDAISNIANQVWQDTSSKWYRKKIKKKGVLGYLYTKELTFDAGEGHGSQPHRITVLVFSIKNLGSSDKVQYGYLQELSGNPDHDAHTGEWH